jgi:hypothetical protein
MERRKSSMRRCEDGFTQLLTRQDTSKSPFAETSLFIGLMAESQEEVEHVMFRSRF